MPDLVAQGPRRDDRWRRRIPLGKTVLLGRSSGVWSVPWDDCVSRQHLMLHWDGPALHVEVLPTAANPVFFQGSEVDRFRVGPGDHFVIGGTTFSVTEESASIATHVRLPATEQTFSQDYLRLVRFHDPGDRLEILSKLPERIATSVEDAELYEHIIRVILEGIPTATAAAICLVDSADDDRIDFLHWDHPGAEVLDASQRLICEAVSSRQTVVHTWETQEAKDRFTENDVFDWAFCTPFHASTTPGWALYVAGNRADSAAGDPKLEEEMKFAEIVVTTAGSFYEVRQLEKQQSSLRQFFSGPVIQALQDGDPDDALAPREVDVTALFCDLRGFSLATELAADDLQGLLRRVSDALGVLTKQILSEGGVIGDFHGDAAMGFWGWPLPQADAAHRAARTALDIYEEFTKAALQQNHSLSRFRIGVGIASGKVVAGKIGTVDQVKITAIGPAVNIASRLEGMTKPLNAPLLLDAETARRIRPTSTDMRLRRLAVVQPYGMGNTIEIYQLLPSSETYPLLTDEHIQFYESALEAFVDGDWKTAWEELHKVPAADPSKDYLTTYIASRSRQAPEGWDGVIRLDSK